MKIPFFAHVIEHTEKDLLRAHCILSTLAERATDAAFDIDDATAGTERGKPLSTALSLLYELGNVLDLLGDNLALTEEHLRELRRDAEGNAAP